MHITKARATLSVVIGQGPHSVRLFGLILTSISAIIFHMLKNGLTTPILMAIILIYIASKNERLICALTGLLILNSGLILRSVAIGFPVTSTLRDNAQLADDGNQVGLNTLQEQPQRGHNSKEYPLENDNIKLTYLDVTKSKIPFDKYKIPFRVNPPTNPVLFAQHMRKEQRFQIRLLDGIKFKPPIGTIIFVDNHNY